MRAQAGVSGEGPRKRIAVVGSGIAGLSAAWLLQSHHHVTLFEADTRIGGHAHTRDVPGDDGAVAIDTGFIVYNERTYPNLTALFAHLGVATKPSTMSFAVSLDDGRLEYAGSTLAGLFAQRRNLVRPRFWAMLNDLRRFYRSAPRDLGGLDENRTLGDYLATNGYGAAFRDDHLLPMAGAIWSAPASEALHYPAAGFIRFKTNHGLLQFRDRPQWRTVEGGSKAYVERLASGFRASIATGAAVAEVRRLPNGVSVSSATAGTQIFDDVIIATHADQALDMLADPSPDEARLLGAFRYNRNRAILHRDERLMPVRRPAWSSWNVVGNRAHIEDGATVTYWMNELQALDQAKQFFVSLNPVRPPDEDLILHSQTYEHPILDSAACAAQRKLWSLQGRRRTFFCGAYFGAGFHEDALQAGLAVAEQVGAVRRPWSVPEESGRITLAPGGMPIGTDRAA